MANKVFITRLRQDCLQCYDGLEDNEIARIKEAMDSGEKVIVWCEVVEGYWNISFAKDDFLVEGLSWTFLEDFYDDGCKIYVENAETVDEYEFDEL
jgi:hypothetical protein